tara:strand:+ start:368 stop:610 length:243 start_codon:yes stop_codon:yes gene_type:complete
MSQKEPLEIELAPEDEWEVEQGSEVEEEQEKPDLSDKAISYLAQIQDLQEQLQQEQLKVERLQMAIRGFTLALQEEIKGL